MIIAIVAVVCLVVGFGAGRIKNAKKLAAIRAEIGKVGSEASAEVKAVVSAVRAKL